jgi:hypothetical protein
VLRLVFFNMGTRKDCIKEIRFFVQGSDVPWTPAMLDRIPLVLNVDEASNPPFLLHRLDGLHSRTIHFKQRCAPVTAYSGSRWRTFTGTHGFPAPVIH